MGKQDGRKQRRKKRPSAPWPDGSKAAARASKQQATKQVVDAELCENNNPFAAAQQQHGVAPQEVSKPYAQMSELERHRHNVQADASAGISNNAAAQQELCDYFLGQQLSEITGPGGAALYAPAGPPGAVGRVGPDGLIVEPESSDWEWVEVVEDVVVEEVVQRKDPNKPKRPATAYFSFTSARRQQILAAEPEMSSQMVECTRRMAKEWQALSEEDRKPYAALAAVDKARYIEAMANYVPPPRERVLKQVKQTRRVRQLKANRALQPDSDKNSERALTGNKGSKSSLDKKEARLKQRKMESDSQLVSDVQTYMKMHKLSQVTVGQEARISQAVISPWLLFKYHGHNDKVRGP